MPFLPGVIIDSTSEGRGKVELEHSKKRGLTPEVMGLETPETPHRFEQQWVKGCSRSLDVQEATP